MKDNIISFIFGSIIKIVDDNYDMKIHNKTLVNYLKIIGLIMILYWSNLGIEYNFILLIETLICYFVKQIDNKYYKYVSYYIIINFLFQKFFLKKNLFDDKFNIRNIILYTIYAVFIISFESKLCKEEYSYKKILFRCLILGGGLLQYLFMFFKCRNSKHNQIIKNALCISNAYFLVSISDMIYMMLREKEILN